MHWRGALLGPALVGLALLGCNPSAASVETTREAVGKILDDWHAAAAMANEERYFSLLTPDAVFLGTDAKERWNKEAFRAYAHPHFERGKAWRFRSTRRAISVDTSGTVAWFDEDLATDTLGPARGSGVLTLDRKSGAWHIAQYNLAITVPNAQFPAVMQLLTQPMETPVPFQPH
ncbi:nuclear transport factor 2 family protein [Chondromyces crocatus]|uniref:SnoaL-like domain-containing protein n=1 Tax=Chondromyces crocatus TaxID=52 RepID=A0A0K1ETK5_CHOCO|nr:nuclear transport factor 2 family protein [Chondromyces crocatus]AKT44114.1 uncharacterized protein CMC5_083540 [Chondromyces crocatus]